MTRFEIQFEGRNNAGIYIQRFGATVPTEPHTPMDKACTVFLDVIPSRTGPMSKALELDSSVVQYYDFEL